MGAALRDKLINGARVTAVDYMQALQRMDEVAGSMTDLLRDFDALVTFGTLHTPPRLGVEPEMTAFTVETALTPFNLSGHPALVQCTGFTDTGLPLHWQIVANRGGERELFRVAAAYEAATGWRDRRPGF
jgi:aspartyl-tRNA(Asn)/glutamyl-tRNA(Gln) amidotransferase subunit A